VHFPDRGELVGNELQPELAEDDVESVVRERYRFGSAFIPSDLGARGGYGSRDRQHLRIRIDGGHRAASPDRLRREPRDNTGAACDVENPFAGTERGFGDEIPGEGAADRRDEVALVMLGD
jgi:hypothetical protein